MVEEYEHSKRVAGFRDTSIYEALLTLRHFERLIGPFSSKQITQNLLDKFILKRGKEVKRYTLNKDISNFRAFINWARKNRYLDSQLEVKKVKVDQLSVNALNVKQVKALLAATLPYSTWRMRVLLAITTALRRGDIEALRIGDVHLDRDSISTRSKKTGKCLAERPIPAYMTTELANYIVSLPDGQERLFSDTYTHKKWKRIREKAGLPDLKFHDLRKTFASALAQRGISTAVTQRLLEHSSPELTNQIYTNVDPVLREAVDRLPVQEWLK
jgi:integrase